MYIHICTVGTVYMCVFFFCDCPSNESFFNSGNVSLGNRPDSTIKRIKKKKNSDTPTKTCAEMSLLFLNQGKCETGFPPPPSFNKIPNT